MNIDTIKNKQTHMQSHAVVATSVCLVLFLTSAIAGRTELFAQNAQWPTVSSFTILIPLALLVCFALAWFSIRNSGVKLRDAINLDTVMTLTRDGLYCHSSELMIPWSLVDDVVLERKMQRHYESRADLHVSLKEPLLGKTVYTFDAARLCVPSQRVHDLIQHRVRTHAASQARSYKDDPRKSENVAASA